MNPLPKILEIRTALEMATRVAPAEFVEFKEKVRWVLRTGIAATAIVIPVADLRAVARGGGDVQRVLAIYLEGAALAHARKVYGGLLALGATGGFNIQAVADAITAREAAEGRGEMSGGKLLAAMVEDLVYLQVVARDGLGAGGGVRDGEGG